MSEQAKVRIRLDTRQAQAQLRTFTKTAAASARRINGGVTSALGGALGGGLRALGAGAAFGAGIAAVRGAATSGLAGLADEKLGGYLQDIKEGIYGDRLYEREADRRARDAAVQQYGYTRYHNPGARNGAQHMFDHVQQIQSETLKGQAILDRELRDYAAEKLADKVTQSIDNGIDRLERAAQNGMAGK